MSAFFNTFECFLVGGDDVTNQVSGALLLLFTTTTTTSTAIFGACMCTCMACVCVCERASVVTFAVVTFLALFRIPQWKIAKKPAADRLWVCLPPPPGPIWPPPRPLNRRPPSGARFSESPLAAD